MGKKAAKGKRLYILFESASGYGVFDVVESDQIGQLLSKVQQSITDPRKFSEIVKMKGFQPFVSPEDALENQMAVSEGLCHDSLKDYLALTLPACKDVKKAKYQLGVSAPTMGNAIQEELNIPCVSNEVVKEIVRGIRLHFTMYLKALAGGKWEKAQLGLAHSYSRAKIKFNANRNDNMIIQAICLLDQMDKDLNKFAMRVREWYGWHFPELVKIVNDNYMYARLVKLIGDRNRLKEADLEDITKVTMDEDMSKKVLLGARSSMGMDVSEADLANIHSFATRLINLQEYRVNLYSYLQAKMAVVAPNLGELIGEVVAARLISHAGSLTNLAKCPASTVQILGAEKALFRALKTKGNTPKYGLIFHSSFISRAKTKDKGRISRYLANKCAMSARIDAFSDYITNKFGAKMKEQVEERLRFYADGTAPRKNLDVMHEVMEALALEKAAAAKKDGAGKEKKKSKKRKVSEDDGEKKKKKKSKKDKKDKKKKKKKSKKSE